MPEWFTYELWNGKKTIGEVTLRSKLLGKFLVIPTISELKREYGRSYETINVPIIYRTVSDNGVEIVVRRCLDVRKNSKRQKALIAKAGTL